MSAAKAMRAASDLHLSAVSEPWVRRGLQMLRSDAERRGGPTILPGDILDQAEVVPSRFLDLLADELSAFPMDDGADVVIILGNHDMDNGRSPLRFLDGLANIRVIDKPCWTEHGLMVPYVPRAQFAAAVQEARTVRAEFGIGQRTIYRKAKPTKKDPLETPILWCHQGVSGAWMNNLKRDEHGVAIPEGLPVELVVTGHYHPPQVVGKVVYCGSLTQVSFAEEGQIKGFLSWEDARGAGVRALTRRAYCLGPNHWTVDLDPKGAHVLPGNFREGDIVRVRPPEGMSRKEAEATVRGTPLAGARVVERRAASKSGPVYRSLDIDDEAIKAALAADLDPEGVLEYGRALWPRS